MRNNKNFSNSHNSNIENEYKTIKIIGKGSYGVVVKSIRPDKLVTKTTKSTVAIKKVTNVLANTAETIKIIRELKILRLLHHPNIIPVYDAARTETPHSFDVYIVMECMRTDLYNIIQRVPLDYKIIANLLFQILSGVDYMHSKGIIHRDLKTRNILVDKDCTVKIADFGLARKIKTNDSQGNTFENDPEEILTEYVVTRWYRAPEIICGNGSYSFSSDLWSVGCIFAELLTKKVLFRGRNYIDQLRKIFEVLGVPQTAELECVLNTKALEYIRNLGGVKGTGLRSVFKEIDEDAFDLLEKLLVFDPKRRISTGEALAHRFFTKFGFGRERKDESVDEMPLDDNGDSIDWEFDVKTDSSREVLRRRILREIAHYRPFVLFSMKKSNSHRRVKSCE